MAVYLTGDTHGVFRRLHPDAFPEQARLTKSDCVLITGDFGAGYSGITEGEAALNWLEARPFTTLFVTGNHENYGYLRSFPEEDWRGGRTLRLRPSVRCLLRGQCFDLDGFRFFTMGGAGSRDVEKLDPRRPLYRLRRAKLERLQRPFWVRGETWWPEELPCDAEYETARRTLERLNWTADFLVTHCAPSSVEDTLEGIREAREAGSYRPNRLTAFLQEIADRARFRLWFLGHYHLTLTVRARFMLLYDEMVRIQG